MKLLKERFEIRLKVYEFRSLVEKNFGLEVGVNVSKKTTIFKVFDKKTSKDEAFDIFDSKKFTRVND